jgi:hypothetical protein
MTLSITTLGIIIKNATSSIKVPHLRHMLSVVAAHGLEFTCKIKNLKFETWLEVSDNDKPPGLLKICQSHLKGVLNVGPSFN